MPVMKDASILAVGGCGGMGQAATKLIAENYGAGRLTIADFNLEAAQSWAEGLQKGFVDSAFVDLTKPESFVETFPRASGLSETKSVRVTTLGVKGGSDHAVQYEVVVDSRPDWELTATAVWTGFPAAVAAKLVLAGKARVGAHAPESLFEPDDILPELAAVGCAIVPSPEGDIVRHR